MDACGTQIRSAINIMIIIMTAVRSLEIIEIRFHTFPSANIFVLLCFCKIVVIITRSFGVVKCNYFFSFASAPSFLYNRMRQE